jgi:tetratricopeptide (TPR) repeat protein
MIFMKNIKITGISILALLFSFAPLLSNAQDFDDLNDQADKEYTANNYNKAIELVNRAINLKENSRSYFIRADCRFSLNDYESALSDYNTAISNYSNYYTTDKYKGRLYYWRARCKQKLSRWDDAITDFNSSFTYNYEEPGYAYWNRGNCYYEQAKYQPADDDYANAIERLTDSKDLAKLSKYRADCLAHLYKYEEADKLYIKAISYNPDFYNAYWSRAYYRNLDMRQDDAIADYKKAISIIEAAGSSGNNDDLAAICRNLALIYYDKVDNDEALRMINKALLADPNYIKGFLTRADIYQQMNNYEKARSDYNNAISLTTDDKALSNLYFDRSYKLDWKVVDYRSALDNLNKSIELDPKDGMKYWHRAITYDYKKDYPRALADIERSMQVYGDGASSGLYTLRASIKEKTGDFKGAISDYQAALKLNKNSASIYYNLGRLFKTKMNNDDLAQTNLDKAIDLAKDDGTTATGAYARVVKGETQEAIAMVLDKVDKYKDDKYEYKWQLHNAACIYALSGNKPKALEYLDKSLAAGYDDYNHLVNDRDLVSLTVLPQYKAILTKYKVPQPKW